MKLFRYVLFFLQRWKSFNFAADIYKGVKLLCFPLPIYHLPWYDYGNYWYNLNLHLSLSRLFVHNSYTWIVSFELTAQVCCPPQLLYITYYKQMYMFNRKAVVIHSIFYFLTFIYTGCHKKALQISSSFF